MSLMRKWEAWLQVAPIVLRALGVQRLFRVTSHEGDFSSQTIKTEIRFHLWKVLEEGVEVLCLSLCNIPSAEVAPSGHGPHGAASKGSVTWQVWSGWLN